MSRSISEKDSLRPLNRIDLLPDWKKKILLFSLVGHGTEQLFGSDQSVFYRHYDNLTVSTVNIDSTINVPTNTQGIS